MPLNAIDARTNLIPLTLLALGILSCSDEGTSPQAISLQQAEHIVLSVILDNNDSGKVVYELPKDIPAGTLVKADSPPDATGHRAPNTSWFFFIDDQPGHRWAHPCRYVFISCTDGKHIIIPEDFYPDNFDELREVAY